MSISLPTPPRTSSHKDKENQPPTPPTPSHSDSRIPRIIWSQENLHHAYTTQIRQLPSSSLAQGPQKSILKKPSFPFTSLMPPEQPAREVTPEPADPLQHPFYLNSPVSTLAASLKPGMDAKLTLTDLTEAYSVLSARLKTKTHGLLEICGPIPALQPLREYSAELVKALHRDIGRAFVDPQASPPPSAVTPWSTPSSVGSVKKRGFTDEEVKHARDLCNLCHAAMRCFSNISVVPVLSSVFTDEQLRDILTDILAIPLAPSLPTPNARKTCQIAVWTLQVQRLPTVVLAPAADRITYALRRGIDGELGREGKKGAASDGLKAVVTLASYQPAIFLPPFAEILPSIFACLTSQNFALRTQAAHAILSLSHALAHLQSPPASLVESFSQTTIGYIDDQRRARNAPQELSPLGKAFSLCINTDTPTQSAQSPMWALSVIAAMIVLSGADVLSHPRTIKFVLGHLQTAMGPKRRSTVRATTGIVWRALIWACVQLDKGDETDERKNSGWRVVRQIVDGAIGVSIIAALLGQSESKAGRISHALEVVNAMIKKGGKTCEEAVEILDRLLCGVGSSVEARQEGTWLDSKLLSEPLFDGTFLDVEWKHLAPHIKHALTSGVAISDIRPLQEDEVVEHWDVLFVIWKAAVERAPLGEDGDVPSPLLSAWHALLLTQAQLTQGYEHLSSEPAFITRLTELLKSFLSDQKLEWSLDAGAPSWSSQSLKLGFVRNLWNVARNVFAIPALTRPAEFLLREVLKHEYHLEQSEVRNAWAMLCSELVMAGLPQLVKELWNERQQGYDLGGAFNRGLWRVVSGQWVDQAGSWDGAIQLLRAPFAMPIEWEFEQDDLDLWIRLLDCSFFVASARKISPNTVLDSIAHEIGTGHNHKALHSVLPVLLSAFDASAPERSSAIQLPSLLLTLTNDMLTSSYPPMDTGIKLMLFAVMKNLTEIVKTSCKEITVELLICIQDGIRLWVQDEKDALSDQELNEKILPLYIASMEALKAVPPCSQTLHALTPLLSSAFSRIPEPALGPSAFKSFWDQTYSLHDLSELGYPENLKPILRTVQQAMCTSDDLFAPGLSLETHTQRLRTEDLVLSIVPDSLEEQVQAEHAGAKAAHDSNPVLVTMSEKPGELIECPEAASPEVCSPCASPASTHELMPKSLVYISPPSHSPSPTSLPDQIADIEENISSKTCDAQSPRAMLMEKANPPEGHSMFPAHLIYNNENHTIERQLSPATPPAQRPSVDFPIKEESQDLCMNTCSSQGSSRSSLGKRRRSRHVTQANKKRKAGPPVGVDILNISDDESSEKVALDLSIVVARSKRRKSDNDQPSRLLHAEEPFTPKSIPRLASPSYVSRKRTLFEAVEIWRMGGDKLHEHAMLARTPQGSPCKGKAADNRTHSKLEPSIHERGEESGFKVNSAKPSKRRRLSDMQSDAEALDHWNGEFPHQGLLFIGSDDSNMITPQRQSDSPIPSTQPGQISATRIISPLPHRSRSEAYDPPSDDSAMSSSPLKQVAARHQLQRARTAPAVVSNDVFKTAFQPKVARSPSEEFLALEHAHDVVTSGASNMRLQELLEATRMVNSISTALSEQISRKLSSDSLAPL